MERASVVNRGNANLGRRYRTLYSILTTPCYKKKQEIA